MLCLPPEVPLLTIRTLLEEGAAGELVDALEAVAEELPNHQSLESRS